MIEELLILLDDAIGVPGVTHVATVTPERQVLSAAREGQGLKSDDAWIALLESFEVLVQNKLPGDTLRWVFPRWCVLSFCTSGYVFVAVVQRDLSDKAHPTLRRKFEDVVGSIVSQS